MKKISHVCVPSQPKTKILSQQFTCLALPCKKKNDHCLMLREDGVRTLLVREPSLATTSKQRLGRTLFY